MPFQYNFGKTLFSAVQRHLDCRQRASHFDRELSRREKQMGLLNIIRQRTLDQDESQFKRGLTFKEGQQEDLTTHREDVTEIQGRRADIAERSADTAERRADIAEDQLDVNRGLLGISGYKAETDRIKAQNTANQEKDVSSLYGNIHEGITALREDHTDEQYAKSKGDVEALMESAGLKGERDLMLRSFAGKDPEDLKPEDFKQFMKTLKAYRRESDLPEVSQNDEDYLKSYFDVISLYDD